MALPMLSDPTRLVTGGVDTHKDTHVAVVVDHLGRHLGLESFPTNPAGYSALLSWMSGFGPIERVGVEGTGSWGAGLARFLSARGVSVVEVARPDRRARRLVGKSDPIDAQAAAISALSGRETAIPKAGDGPVESIRVLRGCRHSAVRDKTAALNQLRSLIDTAPDQLRGRYRDLTTTELITKARRARPRPDIADPAAAVGVAVKELAQRWVTLDEQIVRLDTHLEALVTATAPNLVAVFGVGIHTAATLLVCAGDNPHRLHSSAAFAALCAVAPIAASSGKTQRHRLNRGGNRQANSALWRVAMTRLAFEDRTKTYADRRTTEGLSKREIMRCLKRAIARELYPIIITDLNPQT